MISRSTNRSVRLGDYVPTADGRVVLRDVTWEGWEALLAMRGDKASPRFAYLDGVVEIMSPSRDHEYIKGAIGRLVEAYCLERDLPFTPYGAWTQKRKPRKAGLEPDECYVFGMHPKRKRRPELAIEVNWTRGGIDKLEIYRRLQIAEVWFWEDDVISVHVLGRAGYKVRARSACLPDIDLVTIARLAQLQPVSEAIKRFRATLRA